MCGRFAIQLDSDDLYFDKQVIKTIVDCFYRERCAMVVGSYSMVNFKLEEIPPGIIDHKEWTPTNGPTTPCASMDLVLQGLLYACYQTDQISKYKLR